MQVILYLGYSLFSGTCLRFSKCAKEKWLLDLILNELKKRNKVLLSYDGL